MSNPVDVFIPLRKKDTPAVKQCHLQETFRAIPVDKLGELMAHDWNTQKMGAPIESKSDIRRANAENRNQKGAAFCRRFLNRVNNSGVPKFIVRHRESDESLGYYERAKTNRTFGPDVRSSMKVDVIIPTSPKDLGVLPLAVDSVRENLRHPIGRILVLSENDNGIAALCADKRCVLIDEESLIPISKGDLRYTVNGVDRSGWLFQQFLKLSGDLVSSTEHFLVLDADTVLLQPQVFELDGKAVLLHSDEHHDPYFAAYERLFGVTTNTKVSFVSHQMLFEKAKLRELKRVIEDRHEGNWYDVILQLIDRSEASAFSEYETYGQWMLQNYCEGIIREYWFNIALGRSKLSSLGKLIRQFGDKYRSISFHSYLR